MLIGNIYIVDRNVRIVDVDGSYLDVPIEVALALDNWVPRHRMRLLEALRSQQEAERKKEKNYGKTTTNTSSPKSDD